MTALQTKASIRHVSSFSRAGLSPAAARSVLIAAILVAAVAGYLATDGEAAARAVSNAGGDLARLLRMMAMLKAVMALGAAAAVFWRLGAGVSLPWLAAYVMVCGSMSAGPALIWTMAHVGFGSLLLHGGLAGTILLLWRDPGVSLRLAVLVAKRRDRCRGEP